MDPRVGQKLDEGGCAEIFEWLSDAGGPEKVLKLAKVNADRGALAREYRNTRLAWNAGLPAARPYEFVEIDGRPGFVLERIMGETLMDRFIADAIDAVSCMGGTPAREPVRGTGRTESGIRLTARILSEIHGRPGDEFPDQRRYIREAVLRTGYLSQAEREAVVRLLDGLPKKHRLCHGDPNPRNVFPRDGEAPVIIDWMDATCGNPEADLAEYIVMVRFAVVPSSLPREVATYLDPIREWMVQIFLDEYEKRTGIGYDQVDAWIVPVAARKLTADAISHEEKTLLVEEIRRRIAHP